MKKEKGKGVPKAWGWWPWDTWPCVPLAAPGSLPGYARLASCEQKQEERTTISVGFGFQISLTN